MGDLRTPEPAMLVIGVLHADPAALEQAMKLLGRVLGGVRLAGLPMSFRWTDYYREEMGSELTRCFLFGELLVERQLLARLKLLTNSIERDLARRDGSRRINLDPGLLTLENFVLSTTKNRAQRIYLGQGVYAELTLRYIRGRYWPLDWTFPDYRSEEILSILGSLRTEYARRLNGPRPKTLREVPV